MASARWAEATTAERNTAILHVIMKANVPLTDKEISTWVNDLTADEWEEIKERAALAETFLEE